MKARSPNVSWRMHNAVGGCSPRAISPRTVRSGRTRSASTIAGSASSNVLRTGRGSPRSLRCGSCRKAICRATRATRRNAGMTDTATSTTARETHGFQAEVRQLLDLMIHSLYSNREIFLRELISNASDACDKLRFEALGNPALFENDAALAIRVDYDTDARTIAVSDNGIGMGTEIERLAVGNCWLIKEEQDIRLKQNYETKFELD